MLGFGSKNDHQERTAEQKYLRKLVPAFFALLVLVMLSSGVMGYYIGKTVNTGHLYSGQIIDTIQVTPGQQAATGGRSAYSISILGRVLYTDGTPFANGTIELRSEVRYTTTDSLGYFRFDNVAEGNHVISVIQNGVVLARANIQAEKTTLISQAQVIKLNDGSYTVMLPLEINHIELVLELKATGDKQTLEITLHPDSPTIEREDADISAPDPSEGSGESIPGDIPREDPIPGGNTPVEESPGKDLAEPTPVPAPGGGGGVPFEPNIPNQAPEVMVTGENPISRPWTQTTTVDIFAVRPGNSGVRNIDGVNVIAPGAKGKYIFKLKNPEKYPLVYNIDLKATDQNHPALPMRYRLKPSVSGEDYIGGSSWKEVSEIKVGSASLATYQEVYYTLEWKWLTVDDKTDTALGMQPGSPIYILDIIINAWFR